jgi:hypothetical protein
MANQVIPELDAKGLREFGLVTGAIIAALFGLFFPWLFEVGMPKWPFILGGILGAWGLLHPASLRPVYTSWMKFGLLMGRFTTPVIMGIVFYLVVLPVGLLKRLFSDDSMTRRLDRDATSYRVVHEHQSQQHFERPF